MSKSVKLSDGSYIDASAVWDNAQGADIESLITTINATSIKGLEKLTTKNADVYEYANTATFCWFEVGSSVAEHTLTNWIGNTNGIVVKLDRLMFATDGWNKHFYYNIFWDRSWAGWKMIG
jgi:hypothetical protein